MELQRSISIHSSGREQEELAPPCRHSHHALPIAGPIWLDEAAFADSGTRPPVKRGTVTPPQALHYVLGLR